MRAIEFTNKKFVSESSRGIISGVTRNGLKWKFEAGGEVPFKHDVEANTFIRVTNDSGKTVAGVFAEVYGDTLEIEYAEVYDKNLRRKGIYTDVLASLSRYYTIVSDTYSNNAARGAYEKLGAKHDTRRDRFVLDKQGVAEGFNTDVEMELHQLTKSNDMFDAIYNALGRDDAVGQHLQAMANEIAHDHRLHPDDDIEQIISRMSDELESQYSDSDIDEGAEDKNAQQRKVERDKQRTAPAQKARNTAQRKGLTQDKDGTYYAKEGVAEGYSNTTSNIDRRKLNVPALIQKGAIFVTYPHGEQGWETDNKEDWAFSLLSLYNVLQGGWSSEAKKYLKPESYKRAEQQINSSAPNLGSDKLVYDGKYNQILWSIKKLGIPDDVAFLDKGQQGVAEGFDGDEEYYGIIMNMIEGEDGFKLTARSPDGEKLGFVEFSYDTDGTIRAEELEVYEKHRGRGIAKIMYDYVKEQGFKIARSDEQTPAGAGFWDKHRPGKRIWEQDVAEAQSAKSGIIQTDVYGAKAYHAKCMEPNCKWESKRYDRIKQAHAAAEKHAKDHFKQGVTEGFDVEADAYKSNLIKTMPQILDLLTRTVKGWKPSKEELLDAIEVGYNVMRTTGSKQEAGKALGDKLKSLHIASQQGVTESNTEEKITFKLTKGKNKFSTTMMIGNQQAGIYQYDSSTGRSIAEVFPEFKGKGLGKILILNAIKTAGDLSMDFIEDESRTAAYDNVIDSLESNGYIVRDDEYLYLTKNGLNYLNDQLKSLSEMALATYKTMGDFTKPGPFRGVDKKLVPHPKNELKAQKFFEKTPYDFRLFFSNLSGTGRYSEYGPMDPKNVEIIFGDAAKDIIDGHDDAITVVFVGNKGDSKVMLTPWMMAHRFGHAIQAGARGKKEWSAWNEAENHFFNTVNNLLNEYYGKIGKPGGNLKWELTPEYNALFNAIGTQRSSRSNEIRRPYEFLYELFAQYLGTGNITLNPFPTNLGYGRKAWGTPTRYMNIKPEFRDENERKQASEMLARDMELMFDDVLSSSVGKIFVM